MRYDWVTEFITVGRIRVTLTYLNPYGLVGITKNNVKIDRKFYRTDGARSTIYLVDLVVLYGTKPQNVSRLRMKCAMS